MHSNTNINIFLKAYFPTNLHSIIIFLLSNFCTICWQSDKGTKNLKIEITWYFSVIITILYFVNHFDLWEIHVFTFLSFEVVVFIVIPSAFQKTNNFYVLGSFSYWFSILISFLDTKKKIISVQLQKLASYLDYKMIIEFDCAVITASSVGLIKSMLLKYYSNKIYPHHLPTHTNTFE